MDDNVEDLLPVLNRRRAEEAKARDLSEAQAKYTRLASIADEHMRQIMGDPLPYLTQAAQTIARLKMGINKAQFLLSGMDEVVDAARRGPRAEAGPPPLSGDLAMQRNQRCAEHLAKLLREN
jgi:hypothetical protein